MGEIQSNINNMIHTAAIGAGLAASTPAVKDRLELKKELRKLDVEEGLLAERAKAIAGLGDFESNTSKIILDKDRARLEEIAQKRFELQPNIRNYNELKDTRIISNLQEKKTAQQVAADRAKDSVAAAQDSRKTQKDILAEKLAELEKVRAFARAQIDSTGDK